MATSMKLYEIHRRRSRTGDVANTTIAQGGQPGDSGPLAGNRRGTGRHGGTAAPAPPDVIANTEASSPWCWNTTRRTNTSFCPITAR